MRKVAKIICGILPGTIAHMDGMEAGMTPGIMVPDGTIVAGTDGMTLGMTHGSILGITAGILLGTIPGIHHIIMAITAGIILVIIITEVAEAVTIPTMEYQAHRITDESISVDPVEYPTGAALLIAQAPSEDLV